MHIKPKNNAKFLKENHTTRGQHGDLTRDRKMTLAYGV
jgi:hypothetical protein